jgi:hypothetical protein
MKKYLILLVFVTSCSLRQNADKVIIPLSGKWEFSIDSLDCGIREGWFNRKLAETVSLPGSMAENGKGDEVTVSTPWTGEIVDRSYFTDKKYEKYRKPGNIKIPFWLKPVKYYKGPAWYSRIVDVPQVLSGKRVLVELERCHWQSTLFVNGKEAGTENSLSTPHIYDITSLVVQGSNRLSIRIDNRMIVPVGINSHSVTDHTQTNWNGITGRMELRIESASAISDVRIFPSLKDKRANLRISVSNHNTDIIPGVLECEAVLSDGKKSGHVAKQSLKISINPGDNEYGFSYQMGKTPLTWSEFSPSVYTLKVILKGPDGNILDSRETDFGMREFTVKGTRFAVNGIPVFLRGTTECCVFPLTGYPPSDTTSWMRIFRICRDYGLNHMRFHSYCPPEAAFTAADRLGIYLHVECDSWANSGTSVGDSGAVDRYIYSESEAIVKAYGNHPSFCMLAYGNEPAGKNQERFLGDFVKYWKGKDTRRVYTSGAGWPPIPENDYQLTSEPRIQHWGEGLGSKINRDPVETLFDFRDFVSKYTVPVVGHEIGQWCVYPDFSEIPEYTGVLKPSNFEIFKESLEANGLGGKAKFFLKASGKLQLLCYKADIEAALRTPGYAGFQMLQLNDFPGQGTALVGILNPFYGEKGYAKPGDFRMFCNEVVPLARYKKAVFKNTELLVAAIEVANFSGKRLGRTEFICQLTDDKDSILRKEIFTLDSAGIGSCISAGVFEMELNSILSPRKLSLEVSIFGTEYRNRWNIWVYPDKNETEPGDVLITEKFDNETVKALHEGKNVLFLAEKSLSASRGAAIPKGFSTIFWNTAWTNSQPPVTMGILCDPAHPVFRDFPTDEHTDAEWWDAVTNSKLLLLDGLPANLDPLISMIDTWFENRRLALAFEARVANGKLFVCSIDMLTSLDNRPSVRQLKTSILRYMNSKSFNPGVELSEEQVKRIFN